jgi:hypothetical protein
MVEDLEGKVELLKRIGDGWHLEGETWKELYLFTTYWDIRAGCERSLAGWSRIPESPTTSCSKPGLLL